MMLLNAILPLVVSAAQAQTALPEVACPITSATLYKTGQALVFRQIKVSKPGKFALDHIPNATNASLWFDASAGLRLDEVSNIPVLNSTVSIADSLERVLALNINQTVRLLTYREGKEEWVEGKIIAVAGANVIFETGGQVTLIPINRINSVQAPKLRYSSSSEIVGRQLALQTSGQPGTLTMSSIESGLTWTPAYNVSLDGEKASVRAKATVVNNLEELKNVDLKLAYGGATLMHVYNLEPLIALAAVSAVNAAAPAMQSMAQNAAFGARREAMEMKTVDSAADVGMGALDGAAMEDTYVLTLPRLSLPSGAATMLSLFNFEAPYHELFRYEDLGYNVDPRQALNEEMQKSRNLNDVWHLYLFKNLSGKPLTTGPVTLYKGGQVIGQQQINYTVSNSEVEIPLNRALDVHVEQATEEINRERGVVPRPRYSTGWDRLTAELTLEVTNQRANAIDMKVVKAVLGEVTDPGTAKVTKVALGLQQPNPVSRMTWQLHLAPGEKKELKVRYRVIGEF